jgi:hypothetical protein
MSEISLAKTYEKWDSILFPLIKHGKPRERIINTRANHFLNKHIPVKEKQTQPNITSVGRNYTWHIVMVYLFGGSARLNSATSGLPCYDKLECQIYHVKLISLQRHLVKSPIRSRVKVSSGWKLNLMAFKPWRDIKISYGDPG